MKESKTNLSERKKTYISKKRFALAFIFARCEYTFMIHSHWVNGKVEANIEELKVINIKEQFCFRSTWINLSTWSSIGTKYYERMPSCVYLYRHLSLGDLVLDIVSPVPLPIHFLYPLVHNFRRPLPFPFSYHTKVISDIFFDTARKY